MNNKNTLDRSISQSSLDHLFSCFEADDTDLSRESSPGLSRSTSIDGILETLLSANVGEEIHVHDLLNFNLPGNTSKLNPYTDCLMKEVQSLLADEEQGAIAVKNMVPDSDAERKSKIQRFLLLWSGKREIRMLQNILDENVSLIVPILTISTNQHRKTSVKGLQPAATVEDAFWSLSDCLRKHFEKRKVGEEGPKLVLTALDSDLLITGANGIGQICVKTEGMIECGLSDEASVEGMIYCRFTKDHKISSLELDFDGHTFARKLFHLLSKDVAIAQAHAVGSAEIAHVLDDSRPHALQEFLCSSKHDGCVEKNLLQTSEISLAQTLLRSGVLEVEEEKSTIKRKSSQISGPTEHQELKKDRQPV